MVSNDAHQHRDHLDRLIASQKRRHLVAQLMTARRWAHQLEELVLKGVSPTSYGSPLTPLPAAEAERVLQPVRRLMERFRQFVAEQAPEELAEAERWRSPAETKLWAQYLLEQIHDTVEELAVELSEEEGRAQDLHESAATLRHTVRTFIDEAHSGLATASKDS